MVYPFGVSSPCYRGDPVEFMAFNLYAMECEGMFDPPEEEVIEEEVSDDF